MERQIVTLTTDWGDFNCFIGIAKGSLYSLLPDVTVVDITHNVPLNDISQGAFIAKHACPTFPDGTIHIIDIDDNDHHNLIAVKHKNQYYLCNDNGIPHLLFNDEYTEAVTLPLSTKESTDTDTTGEEGTSQTFNALANMIPAIKKIVGCKNLSECGTPITKTNARGQRNYFMPDDNKLIGYIIHVDSHGNAYINICYKEFLRIKKGRKFKLSVHEWETDTLYFTFKSKPKKSNNMLMLSSTGHLMLTHKSGSFAQLMNVTVDSKIEFTFSD